jgi:hypothetical protein
MPALLWPAAGLSRRAHWTPVRSRGAGIGYQGVGAVEFTLASHAPLSKRCFQPVAAARRGSRGGRPAMGAGSGSGRALAPWLLHTRRGSLTDGRPCGRSSCHPFADVRDEASGLGVQPALHAVESRASPNVRHRDALCLSPRAARNAQSQFFREKRAGLLPN